MTHSNKIIIGNPFTITNIHTITINISLLLELLIIIRDCYDIQFQYHTITMTFYNTNI